VTQAVLRIGIILMPIRIRFRIRLSVFDAIPVRIRIRIVPQYLRKLHNQNFLLLLTAVPVYIVLSFLSTS
jgi:hypothetical protein